jgi:hypothetical protein
VSVVIVAVVAVVAWFVWKRVALVSKPTLPFVRERLREAFARRSFDPVEFARKRAPNGDFSSHLQFR